MGLLGENANNVSILQNKLKCRGYARTGLGCRDNNGFESKNKLREGEIALRIIITSMFTSAVLFPYISKCRRYCPYYGLGDLAKAVGRGTRDFTMENSMDTFCFVRPEHLSHQGFLFGGQLLKWIDEYAWLAAARDFPGSVLVTRAMDNIQFRKRVSNGAILRFHIRIHMQGTTSVTYTAEVFASDQTSRDEESVFSTHVTFVAVDEQGAKVTLQRVN